MSNKGLIQIVVALCTSIALIALAVYQRYRPIPISGVSFDVMSAVIIVAPIAYGFICAARRS